MMQRAGGDHVNTRISENSGKVVEVEVSLRRIIATLVVSELKLGLAVLRQSLAVCFRTARTMHAHVLFVSGICQARRSLLAGLRL